MMPMTDWALIEPKQHEPGRFKASTELVLLILLQEKTV